MGGLYVDCGSFTGSDNGKTGYAITFILEGMKVFADEEARALLTRLKHDVEVWLVQPPVEFKIAAYDAQALLPCIHNYRRHKRGLAPPPG